MLLEYDFGYFLPLWNEVALPSVEQLPAVEEPLANSPTLPFFDINPLVPQTEIRNTPAIAEALRLFGKKENARIVQIVNGDTTAFPMDLRNWQGAHGYSMKLEEFLSQPEASFEVVVSQFAVEESETLDVILSKIIPGGVWYFNELLPVDFPGHWLYHAMPATWEWVKKNTLSLHAFYNHLQAECSEIKIKRHVYSQSISHKAAEDVLRRNPRVIRMVSEEALAPAIVRLGELDSLTAEFTIIEGWAKKTIRDKKY
jgi:hypothetical protein